VTQAADEAVRDAATDSVTFSFGDASARIYGLARLGLSRGAGDGRQGSVLAVLFAGRAPVAALARGGLPAGPDAGWEHAELSGVRATIEAPLERWSVGFDASDGQGFALEFAALGAAAALPADGPAGRLGGMAGYDQPCQVRGTVRAGGRKHTIDALGQRGHAWGDADWERVELARYVTAWTDTACATLTAIRPAGARDHAAEATWAALWEPGAGAVEVADGRLSTTYDADGHSRRAGLELWAAGAEWPRRGAGEVACGTSLDLGALRLDCSFFRWSLEGRAGVGRYDIVRRVAEVVTT
jgi:hypothetical protein